MSGSGSWDGYGSPPWDPADPVPDLEDTQALPGLGAIPGPADAPGYPGGQPRPAPGYRNDQQQAGWADPRAGQPRDPYGPPRADAGQAGWNGGPGGAGGSDIRNNGYRNDSDGGGGFSGDGPRDSGPRANGGRSRAAGSGGTTGAHAFRRNPDPGPGPEPRPGPGPGQGPGKGPGPGPKRARRRRSFWRELPVLIIVALVLAVVIKTFAIQAFFIPSASMQNTLEIGDRVLINKIVYHLRPIHRGDIVVFDGTGSWDFDNPPASSNIFSKVADDLEGVVGITHDSSIYIKRVIGLPGDHVACCNSKGQVTVNGVPLSESSYLYPGNAPSTQAFSITVPAGRLWVMGDHRAVSYDSRGHMGDPGGGTIPESGVLGRAFVIIWPPSRWGLLNLPATFEQPKLSASAAAGSNAAAGGSSAALLAAMDNGTPVRPAGSPLPLALGFVGAVPLTLLQRAIRLRRTARRSRPGS